MAELPYQWGPQNSLKHAWIPHAQGLMTTCGRAAEVYPLPPLGGHELACAACHQAVEWYNKTGEPGYLKPRSPYWSASDAASETQDAEEASPGEAEETTEVR